MALSLSSRPLVPTKPPFNSCNSRQPTFNLLPNETILRSRQPISAVHAAEPAKTPIAADKPHKASPPHPTAKWSPESWRTKKALQIPEYPDQSELESVLRTIEAFPPLVFAGEARILEERLAEAAMGKAFLLQGGDCAESFKEFNEINIRDSFRLFLRMSVVLMFGGHLPVIKIWFCWNDSMKQQSCKSKKLVRS